MTRIIARTLGGVFALACLLGAPAVASADDIGAAGHVEFSFPDGNGTLPLPVPPDQVLTVAVEETDAGLIQGVVLLTDGRVIHFDGVRSRPFALTEAYVPERIASVKE